MNNNYIFLKKYSRIIVTIYNLIKKFKEDESIARVTQNNLSNFFSCNEAGISRIIAWLLDSEETHELGNKFSKAFIKQLNKKQN